MTAQTTATQIAPMRPEVKALWVAALRSGEYTQTTGCLYRAEAIQADSIPAGMCCLGVLSDLFVKAHPELASWVEKDGDEDTTRRWLKFEIDGLEGAYLADPVAAWAGLPRQPFVPFTSDDSASNGCPTDCGCRQGLQLAILNDRQTSFAKIADRIEASL